MFVLQTSVTTKTQTTPSERKKLQSEYAVFTTFTPVSVFDLYIPSRRTLASCVGISWRRYDAACRQWQTSIGSHRIQFHCTRAAQHSMTGCHHSLLGEVDELHCKTCIAASDRLQYTKFTTRRSRQRSGGYRYLTGSSEVVRPTLAQYIPRNIYEHVTDQTTNPAISTK